MARYQTTNDPLTLDGVKFGAAVDRLLVSVKNKKGLLYIAGMTALEFIRKYYDQGRDPGTGRAWKKLSQNTIAAKGSSRMLYDTGYTRRSLARGKAGNIFRLSSSAVVIGTSAKPAVFAQEGTKKHQIVPKQEGGVLSFVTVGGRVFSKGVTHPGTPPRRIIGVTKGTLNEIRKRQIAHLKKVAAGRAK